MATKHKQRTSGEAKKSSPRLFKDFAMLVIYATTLLTTLSSSVGPVTFEDNHDACQS